MDLDRLFHALSDITRRRLLDELAERDGQTLFELHVRLVTWQQASLTRQGLSRHLSVLEDAGLLRTEWRWRSKHHFLVRAPLRNAWKLWLGPLTKGKSKKGDNAHEDRADKCHG
jgi:DNA-binding transcriptional ArsR family regulator